MLTRQEGSVFKRREIQPDGTVKLAARYSIKFRTPDGRQVVRVISERKKDAIAELQKALTAIRTDTYQEIREIGFTDYATQWLALREATLKPSTHRTFAAVLGLRKVTQQRRHPSPIEAFGQTLLGAVGPERIARYLGSLTAGGLKPKTVGNMKAILSTVWEDAKASGYCAHNPVRNRLARVAKILTPGDQAEMVVPTPAQVGALLTYLEAVEPRTYAFALTLAGTGMRPGEAAALMGKDLSPATGQIAIVRNYDARAKTMVTPKNGLSRRVDAGPAIFAALRAVADCTDPEAFLLGTGGPLEFDRLRKRWGKLQAAAGCGSWPSYSLRHFAASRMLQEGESLAYVSKQLGHSKQSMTLSHYSRYIPDTKRERGADRLLRELLGATSLIPIQSATDRNGTNQTGHMATQVSDKLEHN